MRNNDEILIDSAISSLTALLEALTELKNSAFRCGADDLLSMQEVANALQISVRTLQRKIKDDPAFPPPFCVGNGRLKKYRRNDILEYLASQRESAQACKALSL